MTTQPDRNEHGYYSTPAGEFPSVTKVLNAYEPKQKAIEEWRDRTDDADAKLHRAGLVGTVAHRRILNEYAIRELPLEDIDLTAVDNAFPTDVDVCEALWAELCDELPITDTPHIEETVWSGDLEVAGTADMITDGVVVDLKTSKAVRDSHKLQAAAYAHCAEQRDLGPIDRGAIALLDYRNTDARIEWLDAADLEYWKDRYREVRQQFAEQSRLGKPRP